MTNRELLEQAMPISTLSRQEWVAIWEYAEYLELTEKGSKLYNQVKEALIEALKAGTNL